MKGHNVDVIGSEIGQKSRKKSRLKEESNDEEGI
jgi:hypothetical protein